MHRIADDILGDVVARSGTRHANGGTAAAAPPTYARAHTPAPLGDDVIGSILNALVRMERRQMALEKTVRGLQAVVADKLGGGDEHGVCVCECPVHGVASGVRPRAGGQTSTHRRSSVAQALYGATPHGGEMLLEPRDSSEDVSHRECLWEDSGPADSEDRSGLVPVRRATTGSGGLTRRQSGTALLAAVPDIPRPESMHEVSQLIDDGEVRCMQVLEVTPPREREREGRRWPPVAQGSSTRSLGSSQHTDPVAAEATRPSAAEVYRGELYSGGDEHRGCTEDLTSDRGGDTMDIQSIDASPGGPSPRPAAPSQRRTDVHGSAAHFPAGAEGSDARSWGQAGGGWTADSRDGGAPPAGGVDVTRSAPPSIHAGPWESFDTRGRSRPHPTPTSPGSLRLSSPPYLPSPSLPAPVSSPQRLPSSAPPAMPTPSPSEPPAAPPPPLPPHNAPSGPVAARPPAPPYTDSDASSAPTTLIDFPGGF